MNTKLLSSFPKTFFIAVMLFLITLFGSQKAHAAGVCYVNASASGANSGASWTDAYTDLQSALGTSPCTEVWVAAGNYKPTGGTDRTISFTLKNGVALYGGFAGTEILRQQRDWTVNVTTLNGDIGVSGNAADNSYHVVVGGETDGTAVLDGFTVTSGNTSNDYLVNSGGGMYNNNSSPTLTNVIFNGNWALGGSGGGMYNINSSPTLTNVAFSGNSAADGGGMSNTNYSNPTLTNVTFRDNLASYGGGMKNSNISNPILTNVTFNNNSATTSGGGMLNASSSLTLTNVTFSGNSAITSGGGIYNGLYSNPTLTNVTFSGNSATASGGGMYNNYGSSPQIKNSIFWGNSASTHDAEIYNYVDSSSSITNSLIAGGCPSGATCSNIITTDPLLGPLANNGGFTQTMALSMGSSAIDTGNDATCASTDQRGVTRPQGAHCDIGAYEWIDYAYHIYLPLVMR